MDRAPNGTFIKGNRVSVGHGRPKHSSFRQYFLHKIQDQWHEYVQKWHNGFMSADKFSEINDAIKMLAPPGKNETDDIPMISETEMDMLLLLRSLPKEGWVELGKLCQKHHVSLTEQKEVTE